jgi:hypothetical protein
MSKLERVYDLRNRFNALKTERQTDLNIEYLEIASPHIERAFEKRMAPGIEGEYDWACADSIIAFVEHGNRLVRQMVEEARLAGI